MSVNQELALALVEELEERGAQFEFWLDAESDQIILEWSCSGTANFQRCRSILLHAAAPTDFGDAFKRLLLTKYVNGRIRLPDISLGGNV